MKKRILQVLKILIPIALGVFLVAHIYRQLDAEQREALFASFQQANYFWIFLSVIMGLASHMIRGHRWKFQMEAMGYNTSGFNNFMAVMVGYVVNMLLPRVGEVSRAAAITKYEGVPFQKSFGTILSERAIDLIVLLTICVVTLVMQYELLQSFTAQFLAKFQEILSSSKIWLVLIGIVVLAVISFFAIRAFKHTSFYAKLASLGQGLMEGLRSVFRMKKRGAYFLSTAAIWLLYIGMFRVAFYALDGTAHLGLNAVFAAFVIGSFAIVLIPGGIGAYPVGIMQSLVLYAVAEETGFALGWIIWISQTAMLLLFGGLSMIAMPIYNKQRKHVSA